LSRRKLIETHYSDINNLADLLGKLVNSYRLLIGGADELNKIALTRKEEIRDALKRSDKLGDIIDDVIEALEHASYSYFDYCEIKSEILKGKINSNHILTEIDDELKLDQLHKS
jgi:hypothetical protein